MKASNDPLHVFVIAEAGVNHNGSIEMALSLVDAAKCSGADAVKFQTFKASNMVCRAATKAEYQMRSTGMSESQLDMLSRLELSEDDHATLIQHCKKIGIEFMSSPFDHESLEILANRFDLPRLKLGSGELTNSPLLLSIARTGKPLILSTGMATLDEVEEALGVLAFGYMDLEDTPGPEEFRKAFSTYIGQEMLSKNVTLLHCTTEYPTPFGDVNLRAMDTISEVFGLRVGFSDHTEGRTMPVAAVARGAQVIEKHFTLDKGLPGPDHQVSLEPDEMRLMIEAIRQTEQGLGAAVKEPASSEKKNIAIVRKSLVATQKIYKGQIFTVENLGVKRPGTGVSPIRYWDYLGKIATSDYDFDEMIHEV